MAGTKFYKVLFKSVDGCEMVYPLCFYTAEEAAIYAGRLERLNPRVAPMVKELSR